VMAAAMMCLGAAFQLQNLGLTALLSILVYVAGFAMSWGPVVWALLSEMFPNAIKGQAMALAVAAQWVANLVVSASFKVLDGNSWLNSVFHHGFSYYFYGVMSAAAALFVLVWVPETKERSLEAIEQVWRRATGPQM